MGSHSEIGGSQAERWMNCPGSVISSRYFTPETSKYAEEGTQAHTVAELLAKGWQPPSSVDPDMVRHGLVYAELLKMMQEYYPGHWTLEEKVHAPEVDASAYGTIDAVLRSPSTGTLVIVDYKYGKGIPVTAVWNYQLLTYASWLLSSMGEAASVYETVILCIHQPRAEKDQWTAWTPTAKELKQVAIAQKNAIDSINNGSTELKAGKWCRWCLAKPTCTQYYETFVKESVTLASRGIQTLTVEELNQVLLTADKVSAFVNDVKSHVTKACLMNGSFGDFIVAPKAKAAQWSDSVTVETLFSPEEYPAMYKKEVKTPKQTLQLYPELQNQLREYIKQESYNVLRKKDEYV